MATMSDAVSDTLSDTCADSFCSSSCYASSESDSEFGYRAWNGTLLVDADESPAADIISTVEFDHTGNYLATGDKGGRVVLFERNESVCHY